jgi:hypothetical protein
MTLIDVDTKLLPDDLTYPLLWLGLLINLNGTFVPLRDAVIGAGRRLPGAVVVSLAVQAGDGQGRHGLRRLQAAGRAGRLARLDHAADDHRAVVGGRRRGRHQPDRVRQARQDKGDSRSAPTWPPLV